MPHWLDLMVQSLPSLLWAGLIFTIPLTLLSFALGLALGLVTALDADHPFAIAIEQRGIPGCRIVEPAAAGSDPCGRFLRLCRGHEQRRTRQQDRWNFPVVHGFPWCVIRVEAWRDHATAVASALTGLRVSG